MDKPLTVVLYILLFLFVLAIGSVVIDEGSLIIANLGQYIMRLFRCADLNPGRRGFGCFVQLIALAIFIGWAIHRFKSSGRK